MRKFEIKSYGRSELAQMYRPYISQKSAWRSLRNWLESKPELMRKLIPPGKKHISRVFTPEQVRMITAEFGEP